MNFFYDLILKFKNYIIGVGIILAVLVLNDVLLVNILKNTNKKSIYDSGSKIAFEDSSLEEVDKITESINKYKVDIKGEVKKPGVYEVDANMNINDVIILAGGLTKKATTDNINLSRKVKDQMVIIIPNINAKQEEKITQTNCSKKSDLDASAKNNVINNDAEIKPTELATNSENIVNQSDSISDITVDENQNLEDGKKLISINSATLEELLTLPAIGESKAKNIISYREKNCFNSIEDIKNVSGIGDSVFEKIKDYITI